MAIIPPDVGGYGMLDQFAVQDLIPGADELQQTATGGVAAGGAILTGLGLERFWREQIPGIPVMAYPVLHLAFGTIGGKLLSTMVNPAIGVGWALGFASLGFIRALQTWLGLDVDLSGMFDGADLSGLADLMNADDLLPPELAGLDQVVIEEGDMGGFDAAEDYMSAVAVETDEIAGFDGWSHM